MKSVQETGRVLAEKAAIARRSKCPQMNSMKRNWLILMLLAGLGSQATGQTSEFATGRGHYTAGEFKKAAAHFRRAIQANPNDAESYYWMGMSYQVLADIAAPFDGTYNSKARVYLTKAMELAPGRQDYRRELFDFLLDSAAPRRTALRQAAGILLTMSESDADYIYMRRGLERESRANSSAQARLGRLFLAPPAAACRIARVSASALSGRRDAEPPAAGPLAAERD
jgi:tetratricopeptide (TPR) repeat protein